MTQANRPQRSSALERFRAKFVLSEDGCWLWTAGKTASGYGMFSFSGSSVRAHRWAYEFFVGPIPEGLELDHLCRNRACVNPAHLEPVSRRENQLRGDTFSARQAAQTHCKRGHEFSEANTRVYRGRRYCRCCITARMRRVRAARA